MCKYFIRDWSVYSTSVEVYVFKELSRKKCGDLCPKVFNLLLDNYDPIFDGVYDVHVYVFYKE